MADFWGFKILNFHIFGGMLILWIFLGGCLLTGLFLGVTGVSKQLSKLNPGKAAGPDNLTSRILKELHSEVTPTLTDIYNSSLRKGKVLDDWRNASVSPVYKKGANTKAENYCPISLTCICCKVMEHVIASNIMAYLYKYQILHSNQHGFRKKTQL